ncbi:hypothetical protein PR048_031448 [Dryococelus australis]|uniref:Tubulin-specific chaperone A n=1 Tax=Dryococelus australis TaxID=614101 RepID=A0ABQ9G5B2_9NEOP|nr:hypothetical protein PR048_031448 [Dryococelus australis]
MTTNKEAVVSRGAVPVAEHSSALAADDNQRSAWILNKNFLLIKSRGLVKAKLKRMQTFVEKHVAGSCVCEMRVRLEGLPRLIQKYDEVQKQLELYDKDSEQHEHDRESLEYLL